MDALRKNLLYCLKYPEKIKHIINVINSIHIPKLNKELIELLERILLKNTNNFWELFLFLKIIKTASSHDYETEDWIKISTDLSGLIKLFFQSVLMFDHCQDKTLRKIIIRCGKILMSLVDTQSNLRDIVVKEATGVILNLICAEDFDFSMRKEIFLELKTILSKSDAKQQKVIINNYGDSLTALANWLPTCGDYETEEAILDILMHFSFITKEKKNTLKHWFRKHSQIVSAVEVLDYSALQMSSREFLNIINGNLESDAYVITIPCLNAFANDIELKKPNLERYKDFWIDFSIRTGSIQILCDSGDVWLNLTIEKDNVKRILCRPRSHYYKYRDLDCKSLLIELISSLEIVLYSKQRLISTVTLLFLDSSKFYKLQECFFMKCYKHLYEIERSQKRQEAVKKTFLNRVGSFKKPVKSFGDLSNTLSSIRSGSSLGKTKEGNLLSPSASRKHYTIFTSTPKSGQSFINSTFSKLGEDRAFDDCQSHRSGLSEIIEKNSQNGLSNDRKGQEKGLNHKDAVEKTKEKQERSSLVRSQVLSDDLSFRLKTDQDFKMNVEKRKNRVSEERKITSQKSKAVLIDITNISHCSSKQSNGKEREITSGKLKERSGISSEQLKHIYNHNENAEKNGEILALSKIKDKSKTYNQTNTDEIRKFQHDGLMNMTIKYDPSSRDTSLTKNTYKTYNNRNSSANTDETRKFQHDGLMNMSIKYDQFTRDTSLIKNLNEGSNILKKSFTEYRNTVTLPSDKSTSQTSESSKSIGANNESEKQLKSTVEIYKKEEDEKTKKTDIIAKNRTDSKNGNQKLDRKSILIKNESLNKVQKSSEQIDKKSSDIIINISSDDSEMKYQNSPVLATTGNIIPLDSRGDSKEKQEMERPATQEKPENNLREGSSKAVKEPERRKRGPKTNNLSRLKAYPNKDDVKLNWINYSKMLEKKIIESKRESANKSKSKIQENPRHQSTAMESNQTRYEFSEDPEDDLPFPTRFRKKPKQSRSNKKKTKQVTKTEANSSQVLEENKSISSNESTILTILKPAKTYSRKCFSPVNPKTPDVLFDRLIKNVAAIKSNQENVTLKSNKKRKLYNPDVSFDEIMKRDDVSDSLSPPRKKYARNNKAVAESKISDSKKGKFFKIDKVENKEGIKNNFKEKNILFYESPSSSEERVYNRKSIRQLRELPRKNYKESSSDDGSSQSKVQKPRSSNVCTEDVGKHREKNSYDEKRKSDPLRDCKDESELFPAAVSFEKISSSNNEVNLEWEEALLRLSSEVVASPSLSGPDPLSDLSNLKDSETTIRIPEKNNSTVKELSFFKDIMEYLEQTSGPITTEKTSELEHILLNLNKEMNNLDKELTMKHMESQKCLESMMELFKKFKNTFETETKTINLKIQKLNNGVQVNAKCQKLLEKVREKFLQKKVC